MIWRAEMSIGEQIAKLMPEFIVKEEADAVLIFTFDGKLGIQIMKNALLATYPENAVKICREAFLAKQRENTFTQETLFPFRKAWEE